MDSKFQKELQRVITSDIPAVMVTIIAVKGSTPRKPGAKMLVLGDGRTYGTVGGGCGEAEVKKEALNVIDNQQSKKHILNMTNEIAEEEGMACGGIMEVYLDYLGDVYGRERNLLSQYLQAINDGEEPVLITVVHSDNLSNIQLGSKLYVNKQGGLLGTPVNSEISSLVKEQAVAVRLEGKARLVSLDNVQLMVEPITAKFKLLILGGGHIALPLAKMGKILGYHVTVVDDRISFANTGRFPFADLVICNDFVKAILDTDIDNQTLVVIVTRGHRHDKVCLREVIKHPAYYIGMIGSKRRVRALLAELQEDIAQERLSAVHTPIGLSIGAETPEEIAVSILAEIINTYRGGKL